MNRRAGYCLTDMASSKRTSACSKGMRTLLPSMIIAALRTRQIQDFGSAYCLCPQLRKRGCSKAIAHPPMEPRMVTATPSVMQTQDAQKCMLPTLGFRSTRYITAAPHHYHSLSTTMREVLCPPILAFPRSRARTRTS